MRSTAQVQHNGGFVLFPHETTMHAHRLTFTLQLPLIPEHPRQLIATGNYPLLTFRESADYILGYPANFR